jgi:methionyl-tRNA synthetase
MIIQKDKFRGLFDLCDIKYNDFIRTTETRHRTSVEHLWNKISSNGFIYKSTYDGWYSINDEAFLSDDQVTDKVNKDGTKIKVSIESGHLVEQTSEVNYLFKLTQFKEDLKRYLSKNVIFPLNYSEKIFRELDTLRDLSISRDAKRLTWGIPVPNDPSQIIYVWLDALTNYLTIAGYPYDEKKMKEMWPADVHIVGKDILKVI